MEEQLKDLNKTLNKMLSTEDRFTEKQRQHIRDKIAKKRSGKFSLLLSNRKPIISTAVTLVLLFAVAQVLFDNISFNGANSTSESADSAAESAESNSDEAKFNIASGDGPAVAEGQLDKAADISPSPPDKTVDAVVQKPVLPLSDKLQTVYENLKSSQSQEALKGLGAFEVMQVYIFATQNFDYETQYIMYYQDPAGSMPSKKLYMDDMAKDPANKENTEKFIQSLQQVNQFNITYQTDPANRREAYLTWGGTGEDMKFFRLIRDQQNDIWTVSYMPIN